MALGRSVDIANNHDPDAILMHKTNHPNTLHLTEDIFRVDLKKYVKDIRRFSYGKLNIENERSGKQKHRYPLRGGGDIGAMKKRGL